VVVCAVNCTHLPAGTAYLLYLCIIAAFFAFQFPADAFAPRFVVVVASAGSSFTPRKLK
jgi:hypothetical protein